VSGAIAQAFAAKREETDAVRNLPLAKAKGRFNLTADAAKKKCARP
jgi:hypothetical protein